MRALALILLLCAGAAEAAGLVTLKAKANFKVLGKQFRFAHLKRAYPVFLVERTRHVEPA